MGGNDGRVSMGTGRSRRAGRPVFDLVVSKLRCPLVRAGSVPRSSLIERLTGGDRRPIVSVVAPAGYGKSTLLAQWAESSGESFAWVSIEEADNDPKVLLTYVTEALDAVEPIDGNVFDALASPVSSVPGSIVPRLGAAFAAMTSPVVLVLDDVDVLHDRESRDAVSVLADHVPGGSRLVLAGRAEPPLRIARLRAEGRLLEIGPRELALTADEASVLLGNAGVVLSGDDVAELHRRTEGWPAGLYLGALYLKAGGSLDHGAASFGGADRFVSDYLESEFLSRISGQQRAFLTRTAVLERMCGPLCEVVLDLPGAGATLADLAESNLLLVPLDRQAEWYRYHRLFRGMLLAELRRQEPELIPVLHRRAAAWCLRNDLPEEALNHSMAAGDTDTVAGLVQQLSAPAWWQGRGSTVQRWFRWLEDQGGISRHPLAAAQASLLSAIMGRPADAMRWADAVDRWQHRQAAQRRDPSAEAWAALLRALLCRRGVEQMNADADEAAQKFATESLATPAPALLQGLGRLLAGDFDGGDAFLADAVRVGQEASSPEELAVALCERSLVAMARGEWDQATAFASQARTVLHKAGFAESYVTPLVCAVHARTAMHWGDAPAARRELTSAQRARSLLTYALPHLAVQARIQLIRVHFALADLAGARTLLREVDQLLWRRPGLGNLTGEAEALRAQLAGERGPAIPGASGLTAAELRLLPMLSTYLSIPQIAEEMFLSPHTIKSQARSIYRKLGASSRSQAIARARELGLLEG